MSSGRVDRGSVLAGVSGLVLALALFLPWYGVDAPGVSRSASAWQTLELIDLALLAVGLVALGWASALATGALAPSAAAAAGAAVAGVVGVTLIVFRIVDLPTPVVPARLEGLLDYGLRPGIFIALVASGGVTAGGLLALRPAYESAVAAPGDAAAGSE